MALITTMKKQAQRLKAETFTLYLAARHAATPRLAKLLIACVVAYAFSPIDLIPDFVPVIGYLDDLVIVPLGIALAIKLVPPEVLADCRLKARESMLHARPVSRIAGAVIILVWIATAALCIRLIVR